MCEDLLHVFYLSLVNLALFRFVGRFMNRRERLEQMGDKVKKFNNVYIKNFSEEIDDEKLKAWFEQFGKIISAKVCFIDSSKWSYVLVFQAV